MMRRRGENEEKGREGGGEGPHMMLARSLEAAATEMRSLLRSSYRRHCLPRSLSQNWQSAAPPAIVPKKDGRKE